MGYGWLNLALVYLVGKVEEEPGTAQVGKP